MNGLFTWILAGVCIVLLAVVVWLIRRVLLLSTPQPAVEDDKSFLLLSQQLSKLSETVDRKLTENTRELFQATRSQSREIQDSVLNITEKVNSKLLDLTKGLTKLDETNKQVINFAEELQNLQDILKNPKQRGVLGEYYLETLLKNVLPPGSFQMQYAFSNGEIVDAAVFVKDKIIPIDSKFSLENYNRLSEARDPSEKERLEKLFVTDLKNRIVETSKYIRPSENTTEFSFMFIPHEAIYYDLLVNKVGAITEETENLIQRAASKYKVIIVSPTSFLAYLQTVLQGLKAMAIEESAKEIKKNVEDLSKHLAVYQDYHGKLGNALGTVVNHYTATSKEFKKIDKDIYRITGEKLGFEPMTLEKPELE
jgi:DNA recombination protein RmuC